MYDSVNFGSYMELIMFLRGCKYEIVSVYHTGHTHVVVFKR